jgi:predicted DNA-binding transcriptional regulator YafY
VVLLQLALLLLHGTRLSHQLLRDEFGLEPRTATRYLVDLRRAGLPVVVVKEGRENSYALHHLRSRLKLEAIDVSPAVAKSLSLLVVAAALLPKNLGVREAVDRTVRQALRVRGLRLAGELRRLEDAVLVLENDAKDYTGREDIFEALFDAVLEGHLLDVDYTSPRRGPERRRLYAAAMGLYRGGLYVLGVEPGVAPRLARWWALERLDDVPLVVKGSAPLSVADREVAVAAAKGRWGPAGPRPSAESSSSSSLSSSSSSSSSAAAAPDETLVTLHFSARAAPFVRARPWHSAVEMEPWADGGMRVSLRLAGETFMLESWLLSWGPEVQVLRPKALALKLADECARAAERHREAAEAFERMLNDDDTPDDDDAPQRTQFVASTASVEPDPGAADADGRPRR